MQVKFRIFFVRHTSVVSSKCRIKIRLNLVQFPVSDVFTNFYKFQHKTLKTHNSRQTEIGTGQ